MLSPRQERLFWGKVEVTPTCWLWTGRLSADGYGHFSRRATGVHRIAFEECFKQDPDKLLVCHDCDVRNCVNPEHFFLGTAKANSVDMVKKGRQYRGARHHKAKLSVDQVREIRRRLDEGETTYDIGRAFRVSAALVGMIGNRKIWRGV